MIRLFRIARITFLTAVLVLTISQHASSFQSTNNSVTTKSPNGRFAVRFSEERSDPGSAGKLWGRVTVRDLRTGIERTVRVAEGQRGKGIFEGFALYEQSDDWSPDGLYLAYWDDQCQDEPAVPGGAICHFHEVRFLSMQRTHDCREELVLSRYAFGGWARGQSHTILEVLINEDGKTVPKSPCS